LVHSIRLADSLTKVQCITKIEQASPYIRFTNSGILRAFLSAFYKVDSTETPTQAYLYSQNIRNVKVLQFFIEALLS
jgi:hypothetical protein